MFCVSYLAGRFNDRKEKWFSAYASALLYFLQKFHEERPGLRMDVCYGEALDPVSDSSDEGENK